MKLMHWILRVMLCRHLVRGIKLITSFTWIILSWDVRGNISINFIASLFILKARYFGKKREEDGHTHSWTVYVKPYHNDDMSVYVKKVHFRLHDSYANQVSERMWSLRQVPAISIKKWTNLLNDVYDVLLNYENSEIIKNQPQSESKVSLSKVEVNTILFFDTNVRHKLEMFHWITV